MSIFDWFRRPSPSPGPMGWINDPARYNAIRRANRLQAYSDQWKVFTEPTKPILLYMAWKLALGDFPAYPKQTIGDCVSHGWSRGNDLRQCVEILGGEPSTYRETWTEFFYGASRQYAGLIGNPNDGSFGSAAAAAAVGIGLVPRDGSAYDGRRAKQWGFSGPPRELISRAKKVGHVARITDKPSLISALWNRQPVVYCGNQGYTMTRDRDGFCKAEGRWDHCMQIIGLRFDRPGVCIGQSWGPNVPDGPTSLGQPDWSFWTDLDFFCERQLPLGETYALVGAPDFEPARYVPSYYQQVA